jgi:hypothetical protein
MKFMKMLPLILLGLASVAAAFADGSGAQTAAAGGAHTLQGKHKPDNTLKAPRIRRNWRVRGSLPGSSGSCRWHAARPCLSGY